MYAALLISLSRISAIRSQSQGSITHRKEVKVSFRGKKLKEVESDESRRVEQTAKS